MKRLTTTLFAALTALSMQAQGWEPNYKGVMLQAFYWVEPAGDETMTQAQLDSIRDAQFGLMKFSTLTAQADELAEFFQLIWTPQSGKTSSYPSMGYDPVYWFDQNGTFGKPSEIRAMTAAFKERGTGIITDVVLNHRMTGSADWCKFPTETYRGADLTYAKKGQNYTLTPADICGNDDGGTTATWASEHGYTLSANIDSGEDFSGGRDLDHESENVQRCVLAYLDYLLNNLGYTGFRLDMTKGYHPKYTGLYNSKVNPQFSVAEEWDSNETIKWWMDNTRVNGEVQSGAFDFQLKWQLGKALNDGNWQALVPDDNTCLAWNSYWPRYAVTFVDNHDTGRDFYINPAYEVAANAYILSMPGTPCVFLRHWLDHKKEIKQLIYARQYAGLTNQSGYELKHSSSGCVSTRVGGTLEILMGNGYGVYDATEGTDMQLVESGNGFALYLSKSIDKPWVSLPTGSYEGPVSVTFTALSNNTTDMVYTTDGTEPTANSQKVTSGGAISLNANTVLKVGLLVGGTVKNVITRNYTITAGVEHSVNIYVTTADNTAPYLYAWSDDGELNGGWPGTQLTQSQTNAATGTLWYSQSLTTTKKVSIIFNNGSGKQTSDITGLDEGNHYFFYDGVKTYQEVTADYVNSGDTPVPEPTITVCVTTKANAAPYLYAWNSDGDPENGEWPGTLMTTSTVNSTTGTLWWTKEFKADELNIIFSNGQEGENLQQTSDIAGLDEGTHYFYYDGATGYELVTADYVNSGSTVEAPFYILGEANGNTWAPNVGVQMTATEQGVYSATVTFAGESGGYSYFSFTKALAATAGDWDAISGSRYGAAADGFLVENSNPMTLQAGQNAFKIAPGTFGIVVDLNRMTVTVGDPTIVGIDAATTQSARQPYYTLQGIRVKQPAKGLYISSGKKVLVK